MKLRQTVINILSNVLNINPSHFSSTPETHSDEILLKDIGMDSINFIKIIINIEKEFSLEVLDSDLLIGNFSTISDICKLIERYKGGSVDEVVKKCLILDCDNVLWDGVSGEEQLSINVGQMTLYKELQSLYANGIYLCLCTANSYNNIIGAFESLKLPIDINSFSTIKNDCVNKANAIGEICDELGIFADSTVFLDDSSYELGLVATLMPTVTRVEANFETESLTEYIGSLFGNTNMSSNTLDRARLLKEQKQRENLRPSFNSVAEYNLSLETKLTFGKAKPNMASRLSELSQRTNRCNLSDMRYSEEDITRLINGNESEVFFLEASDIYGDMGLIGGAVLECVASATSSAPLHYDCILKSFFVSCRVLNRGFEEDFLNQILNASKRFGYKKLSALYRRTEKNKGYESFFQSNNVMEVNPEYV